LQRTAHPQAALAQPLEGLGRGDFVYQVQVNVQHRWAAGFLDDYVVVPDFVEQSSRVIIHLLNPLDASYSVLIA
jgi:hypothetical protein